MTGLQLGRQGMLAAGMGKAGLVAATTARRLWQFQEEAVDIFVPSYLGAAVAFDLAVTGPQRQKVLGEAARKSLAAATAYANVKISHVRTDQICQSNRVRFAPLEDETIGAWEPEASKVFKPVRTEPQPTFNPSCFRSFACPPWALEPEPPCAAGLRLQRRAGPTQ